MFSCIPTQRRCNHQSTQLSLFPISIGSLGNMRSCASFVVEKASTETSSPKQLGVKSYSDHAEKSIWQIVIHRENDFGLPRKARLFVESNTWWKLLSHLLFIFYRHLSVFKHQLHCQSWDLHFTPLAAAETSETSDSISCYLAWRSR